MTHCSLAEWRARRFLRAFSNRVGNNNALLTNDPAAIAAALAAVGAAVKKGLTALGASEFIRDVGCDACRAAPAVQTALGRVGVPLRASDRLKQIGMVLDVAAVDNVQQFRTRKGRKLLSAETKLVLSPRADFDKRWDLAPTSTNTVLIIGYSSRSSAWRGTRPSAGEACGDAVVAVAPVGKRPAHLGDGEVLV